MNALFAPLREAATYRSLLFLGSAIPLGTLALTVLIVGWTLTAVFLITPAVVVVLVGFRAAVCGVARVEALIARELLGVNAVGSRHALSGGHGFWGRAKATVADGAFWREQAYLALRAAVGWPAGIVALALPAASLYLVSLPLTYRWSHTVPWRIDTLQEAMLVLPLGVAGLVLSAHVVRLLARAWRPIAERLLQGSDPVAHDPRRLSVLRRRGLAAHAYAVAVLVGLVTLIWALTGRGTFWPCGCCSVSRSRWPSMPGSSSSRSGPTCGAAACRRSRSRSRSASSRRSRLPDHDLAPVGLGYFWPVWSMLGFATIVLVHRVLVGRRGSDRDELEQRIGVLETTRAGAVDEQECGAAAHRARPARRRAGAARRARDEPRDGRAEARATIPQAARRSWRRRGSASRRRSRSCATSRAGSTRRCSPTAGSRRRSARSPTRSAMPVVVTATSERPAAAVETAAYFVVAEGLPTPRKHASVERSTSAIARDGDALVVRGRRRRRGAAPTRPGAGSRGLRRRVEALDGTLT